jgi:hypothetical protein
MQGVLRSWQCQNARCNKQFDAWEAYPTCPKCGNVRVQWIPGGGHIAGTAAAADSELKKLADQFGLSNLNSARRDQAAKPVVTPPAAPREWHNAMQFAPGFAATPYVMGQNGRPMPVCVPSMQGVSFKTKVMPGNAVAHSRTVPGVHAGTRIEASHRPKP